MRACDIGNIITNQFSYRANGDAMLAVSSVRIVSSWSPVALGLPQCCELEAHRRATSSFVWLLLGGCCCCCCEYWSSLFSVRPPAHTNQWQLWARRHDRVAAHKNQYLFMHYEWILIFQRQLSPHPNIGLHVCVVVAVVVRLSLIF